MFGRLPKDLRNQTFTEAISKKPILKRFIGLTNPYARFAESAERIEEEDAFEKFNQRNGLDILANGYLFKKSVTREEIETYMRSFNDKQVYDRLSDRLKA